MFQTIRVALGCGCICLGAAALLFAVLRPPRILPPFRLRDLFENRSIQDSHRVQLVIEGLVGITLGIFVLMALR